jgi:leucyl aminopeptidase
MRLFVATTAPRRQKTDCAIVGLHEGSALAGAAAALDEALGGRLTRVIKRGDVRGKAGELRLVDTDGGACQRVLIAGTR